MKKFSVWSILVLLALSLTACAATTGGESVKVKCPSCGYQFDVDREGS
jgi:predicted small secreted protein